VNDRGGHEAGDQTLIAVAVILSRLMRATDVAARIGGDEFVLVVAATAPARIALLKREIETQIGALRPLGDADPTRIGAAVGTARLGPTDAFAAALQEADAAAYTEKRAHHGSDLAEQTR
jgi:diguanylate cyclase (GGDEF)-like protein